MPTSRRRVCVTGAGGFIGSAVCRQLAATDIEVAAVVSPPGDEKLPVPPCSEAHFIEITDSGGLADAARGADTLIHLAGPASVVESFRTPLSCLRSHVMGTATALNVCRSERIGRFIYVSSAEVYGQSCNERVSETDSLAPASPYAAAKHAAEALVHGYARFSDTVSVILRPFSVYGPGAPEIGVIPAILTQVIKSGKVTLADPTVRRDFVFVEDVADGIVRACFADLDGSTVINLGTGKATAIGEVARIILELFDVAPVVYTEPSCDRPARANIKTLIADCGRPAQLLDWRATTSLRDGLAVSLEWMKTP